MGACDLCDINIRNLVVYSSGNFKWACLTGEFIHLSNEFCFIFPVHFKLRKTPRFSHSRLKINLPNTTQ